jgi:xanthine/uracil permease
LAALAGAQLDAGRDAYYIGLAFNGLGSALFAWVLFQSRYIPRVLALWGVLSAVYEGFCGFAYLLYPRFGVMHSANWYELPPMTFHLLLCFWLLFSRLKSPETVLASPSAA